MFVIIYGQVFLQRLNYLDYKDKMVLILPDRYSDSTYLKDEVDIKDTTMKEHLNDTKQSKLHYF